MKKKYGIIHLNNFMYVVDKEHKPLETDWYYDSKQLSIRFGTNNTVDGSYKWKILASNDPSLNLPLLPNIEETSYAGFNATWTELIKSVKNPLIKIQMIHFTEKAKNLWKAGYKAASAKKYTEEDMRNAYTTGWVNGSHDDTNDDEFEKSLNPLPITVEVEIETASQWVDNKEGHGRIEYEFVKVVNNIIQVKQWIYEKDI